MSQSVIALNLAENLPELRKRRAKLQETYDTIKVKLMIKELSKEDSIEIQGLYAELAKYIIDYDEKITGDYHISQGEQKLEQTHSKFNLDKLWVAGIIAGIIEVANMTFRLKFPAQWPMNSAVVVAFLPLVFLMAPYILPYLTIGKRIKEAEQRSSQKKLAEAQETIDDLQYAVQQMGDGVYKNWVGESKGDRMVGKNLKKIENLPNDTVDAIRKSLFANLEEILSLSNNNYESWLRWHSNNAKEILVQPEGVKA